MDLAIWKVKRESEAGGQETGENTTDRKHNKMEFPPGFSSSLLSESKLSGKIIWKTGKFYQLQRDSFLIT